MHRPKDVADQLGISPATLRLWSNRFADVLSPAAQKATTEAGTSAQRRYTDSDLAIFRRAKTLLGDGNTYESTLAQLQAEPRPELILPLPGDDGEIDEASFIGGETALSTNLDEHPVFIAFREALAAKDETIRSKDQTIVALEGNLADLRRDHESLLERVQPTETVVSVPWWKRLFGAGGNPVDSVKS